VVSEEELLDLDEGNMIWSGFLILGSLYGVYCIYFGIRYGLIRKDLPRNYWRGTRYTGKAAVRQGYLYIVAGSLSFLILLLGFVRFGF
jgi:hypothetical protein